MKKLVFAATILLAMVSKAQVLRDDPFITVKSKDIVGVTCERVSEMAGVFLISYWGAEASSLQLTSTIDATDLLKDGDTMIMMATALSMRGSGGSSDPKAAIELIKSIPQKRCDDMAANQLAQIKTKPEGYVRFYAPKGNIRSLDVYDMDGSTKIAFMKAELKSRIKDTYRKLMGK